ncbi:MAG: hypothetical protein WCS27_10555 [Victivallaceae bacterium]
MKTKYKKLIITSCFVGWGMLWLIIAAVNFNFLNYENGTLTILGYICFYSIILARFIAGVFDQIFNLNANILILIFVFQFFIYAFIGWGIARLVYHNRKFDS